jgi:anti-sigma B factor antagonist
VEQSKILVARHEKLAFMQVLGRGSFQNAGQAKSFYTELLKDGVERFVVDLNECTYLDSTFLGTLTGLGLKLREAANGKLHIVNVSTRNMELLQTLGLDRLFAIDVCALDFKPKKMDEAAPVRQTKEQSGQDMLEAHENLIRWDERNAPKFKDVVTYLREDLGLPPTD